MCISGESTTGVVSGEAVAVFLFFCFFVFVLFTQNLAMCLMIVPVKSLCVDLSLQVHSVTEILHIFSVALQVKS